MAERWQACRRRFTFAEKLYHHGHAEGKSVRQELERLLTKSVTL